jgi:hypothetical protein
VSEGFAPGWLAMREPHDLGARSPDLLRRLAEWRRGRGHVRIVDLGSGTGSNLRGTAPALGADQDWTLVEWDPHLIATGERLLRAAEVGWRYRRLDLASDLETLADGPVDLVTAAALLDLVSPSWLARLVELRRHTAAALYVVLTIDGRIAWEPADPTDRLAGELVEDHQHTDKGFGRALGPDAADGLESLLRAEPGELHVRDSDWCLGSADAPIQLELLAGYAGAASATAPARTGEIAAWAGRRRARILSGGSALRVGHRDLLFLPG